MGVFMRINICIELEMFEGIHLKQNEKYKIISIFITNSASIVFPPVK